MLKIGMPNPLPEKTIREFASKVKKLYVIEELDPVIETQVKAMGIECTGKSLFSAIGVVMLTGIVVNNGIVLVDYTNQLRAKGMSVYDACIEAAAARIRPILMTSTTTIFAMMPMAFSHKEGPNMTQPIALTVLGGLLSATLITLFFIPIMYYIFNKGADKKKQR